MQNKNLNFMLLNYSKKIYMNFNLLYIYNLFINNVFIIFLDSKQFKSKELYLFKNELYELNMASKILLNKDKKKIFNKNFLFLGNSIFCIFIKDITSFIKICNILFFKKIVFFFSFKKKISNLLFNSNQIDFIGGKVFIIIHFIIYKLILNIIILLLYLILILIKFLRIK